MVEIIEASTEGDVRMTLPVKEAVAYLQKKKNVYIYVDGEMTKADDIEVRLQRDEQIVDVTLPLTGGRDHIIAPVEEKDAFKLADKLRGIWVYNTRRIKASFAQVKKLALVGADDKVLFEKRM